MNTVLSILFAVGVTFIVTNAVPSATINPIKLLPIVKESTLASAQAKSSVNLQSSAHEEQIKLFAEPLEKPNFNRTENNSSEHSQAIVPNLLREPIKVVWAKTSLPLPNKVIGEQHLSKGKKAFVDGQIENNLSKYYINDGISDVMAQTPPLDLLDLRSSEYHMKNMDELAKPLQQENVLASPQRLGEENSNDIFNREKILVPDPGYQPSKVLGNEFKFTIVPNHFIRLTQDSIVAPPQDYLVELVDKSVGVQKYDLTLGEMLVPNILAQQAIDALKQESAAVFKLDSITSSALKYLRPPLADLKSKQDGMRSSLDLLKESDAEPVKTISYLWESDEYGKLGSEFSQYGEETRTGNDEENDDNNSMMTPNNFKRYQRFEH